MSDGGIQFFQWVIFRSLIDIFLWCDIEGGLFGFCVYLEQYRVLGFVFYSLGFVGSFGVKWFLELVWDYGCYFSDSGK